MHTRISDLYKRLSCIQGYLAYIRGYMHTRISGLYKGLSCMQGYLAYIRGYHAYKDIWLM